MFLIVISMIFLATVFMWPDTIYRMRGDLELVRKMTGLAFGILMFIAISIVS